MPPTKQFPVPELVDLGGLAEQAGFDLIATSDHFHLGRRTSDTLESVGHNGGRRAENQARLDGSGP
jgi:alkanesulfonate monooxygenase SsuD/methylene tetrahydromethanopterin reductase-like flavin-dependent oxidoreductase (luciferase family)